MSNAVEASRPDPKTEWRNQEANEARRLINNTETVEDFAARFNVSRLAELLAVAAADLANAEARVHRMKNELTDAGAKVEQHRGDYRKILEALKKKA